MSPLSRVLGILIVLFIAPLSGAQVSLSWQDNSANELGFTIERAVGDGAFATIANRISTPAEMAASGSRVAFVDSLVASSTTYRYRIAAYNGGGASAFSNIVAVTTPDPLPAIPAVPGDAEAESEAPAPYVPPEPTVTLSAGASLRVVASASP